MTYHEKIFITFNKMSDLRKIKLENVAVSKSSIEPENIRWADLDSVVGDFGATAKFVMGVFGSLLIQYALCEFTDQLGQYLIEEHSRNAATIIYRYFEALAIVLFYKTFHSIWKNVVSKMQFPDKYSQTSFNFRASVVLGFTYLGVIPLISSMTGPIIPWIPHTPSHSGLSQ